jgi:hypothetical protein
MLNVSERPRSSMGSPMPPAKCLLGAWLGPTLDWTGVQVKQRGNVLHVLCEGENCPDRILLTQRLQQGIATSGFIPQLTPDGAIIHRLVLYGRITGQAKPTWGQTFELNDDFVVISHPSSEHTSSEHRSPGKVVTETLSEALTEVLTEPPVAQKRKLPSNEGIAHHLSRHLSPHNVSVRVKRKAVNDRAAQRLFVMCESVYSPDPNLIVEPLAQCLRELALRDCQDALISGQVKGETEPDWVVRVDLTPADQMLRSRAQWGDMVAMERLLTPLLKDCCQGVAVSMEQTTMHVVCRHDRQVVPQNIVVKVISEFLTELAPQGIKNASLYGVLKDALQETTQWVHWLDLPAMDQLELAVSPEDLVRRGNLMAIGQLLTRQMNPDLTQQLATGGIRVQVRQRDSVLHVMTDALKVPQKDFVIQQVKQYLLPLGLEDLTGLCLRTARRTTPAQLATRHCDCLWGEAISKTLSA